MAPVERRHQRLRVAPALAGALLLFPLLLGLPPLPAAAEEAPEAAAVARGEVVFNAAGCLGCHTDAKRKGARLAGGRPLPTPFGTFYSPNITPDQTAGLGAWSEADFVRALRQGVNPAGAPYYPAFPYTAYTGLSDQDLHDLWLYLRAQPAVAQSNRPHELAPPYAWRAALWPWRLLFFREGPLAPEPARDAGWNRGRYLVQALTHCGECHTPRGWLGDLDAARDLAGNPHLPDGDRAPNLTPERKKGLGGWSDADLADFLESGIKPDGDVVGGSMAEVVRNSTSKLSAADRQAIIGYLRTVPVQP